MPRVDRVREAVGVSLGRQVSLELRDEEPAVGEDQDPEVPRRFDESGRGDRLAGGRRVAEAVASRRARVLAGERRLVRVEVDDAGIEVVVLLVELGRLGVGGLDAVAVAVSVPVLLGVALIRRDQLGQHSGERIDLMAPEIGSRRRLRLRRCEHPLEAEHQAVVHSPAARRRAVSGVHLGDGVFERAPARGARSEGGCGVLTGVQERLAVPGLSAERGGL